MQVILVIGPSGVGKSACGKYAERTIPGCKFYDLDELVRGRSGYSSVMKLFNDIGPEEFFRRCQREVDALLKLAAEGLAVVAVGAGAQEFPGAHEWISQHPAPTIAVVAPSEEVHLGRTLAQFSAVEYSPLRRELYASAKFQCDMTGLTLEETQTRFANLIREVLGLN